MGAVDTGVCRHVRVRQKITVTVILAIAHPSSSFVPSSPMLVDMVAKEGDAHFPLLERNGDIERDEGSDEVAPLLSGRGGLVESCQRCGNFCFFFTICSASLVATMASTAVCIADTSVIVSTYVWLAPEFRIMKPETGFVYHFNHTVNDLVWSSCVRSLVEFASHAVSKRENLYAPYLYVSLIVAVGCVTHVILKARFFAYDYWAADRWVAPCLFAMTVAASVAHVALAVAMRRHALLTIRRQKTVLAGLREIRADGENADADTEVDVPAMALADENSRFADIHGVRIHYNMWNTGCDQKVAVVFVHGFGAGVFAWRKVAPALASSFGITVVAFDRPGFGLSGRPIRGEFSEDASPYAVTTQAKLTEELCLRMGIVSAIFVGHADGCLVAMRAAAQGLRHEDGVSPPRVRTAGLVLLSVNAQLDAAVPAPVRLLLNTKLGLAIARPLLRSEIGEVANRRAWYDPRLLTGDTLALYRRPLFVEGWYDALLEAARTRPGVSQRDISRTLDELAEVPTLMITGANDIAAPSRRAVAVASELNKCTLKLLPRCGHLPHEEAPGELIEALAPFILEHLRAGKHTREAESVEC